MKTSLNIVTIALLAAATAALAQNSSPDPAAAGSAAASTASAAMSDGEVRRIDPESGKLTLRHGPITNLEMPGMTMVFRVADAKMLDALKPGDKVRFIADRINGAITVTHIEVVK